MGIGMGIGMEIEGSGRKEEMELLKEEGRRNCVVGRWEETE
jgi:hypothetical protein